MSLSSGLDLVKNSHADSLFTKSPPFLRDIIFISRKHSLLFSIYVSLPIVGEPEIQKFEKSGRKIAEF